MFKSLKKVTGNYCLLNHNISKCAKVSDNINYLESVASL